MRCTRWFDWLQTALLTTASASASACASASAAATAPATTRPVVRPELRPGRVVTSIGTTRPALRAHEVAVTAIRLLAVWIWLQWRRLLWLLWLLRYRSWAWRR
jgi:hypothetical protein